MRLCLVSRPIPRAALRYLLVRNDSRFWGISLFDRWWRRSLENLALRQEMVDATTLAHVPRHVHV